MGCGSYHAIQLLEHAMEVEKVFEQIIRKLVKIDKMQFRFTPGSGTIYPLWYGSCRSGTGLQGEGEEAVLCDCGFRNVYDRVPREVVRWAMRKLGVPEWLVLSCDGNV